MYKVLKQIFFILNVFFIFIFEVSKFTVFKDYYNFIENLTQKLASINILYVKVFQAIALNNKIDVLFYKKGNINYKGYAY